MRNKLVTTILAVFLILSYSSYSQSDSLGAIIYKAKTDTIKIQSIERMPLKKWYESSAMPWIASLIIAFLTVCINLVISISTRRTTIKTVRDQIENSARLASLQYNATLNSTNRQEWINDVRDCISELIAQSKQLNIEFQSELLNKEKQDGIHEKLSYNRNKLRLLLTPHIPEHSAVMEAISALMDLLDFHLLNSKNKILSFDNFDFMKKSDAVIDFGRQLLYFEWQKIQNVEFKK